MSGRKYYQREVNMAKVIKAVHRWLAAETPCNVQCSPNVACPWGALFQVPRTCHPWGDKPLALQPPAPASSALPEPGCSLRSPESCPLSPCAPGLHAPATEFPQDCRVSAPPGRLFGRPLLPVPGPQKRGAGVANPVWFQNENYFII